MITKSGMAEQHDAATTADDEKEAKARLGLLMEFVQEIVGLGSRTASPQTELVPSKEPGNIVLTESSLRKLLDLQSSNGTPAVSFPQSENGSVWLRLRRPDPGLDTPAAKACRNAYADLFSARQESLRSGVSLQLTMGVGVVQWQCGKARVDHPLVLIPAELQLADDGAIVVRMADAASASLWLFPGTALLCLQYLGMPFHSLFFYEVGSVTRCISPCAHRTILGVSIKLMKLCKLMVSRYSCCSPSVA